MYLVYVDESGDTGLTNSPTQFFVLSGLVVHELRWLPVLQQIIQFRRWIRGRYGLRLREELHASRLITKPGVLSRIAKHERLAIIRTFANFLSTLTDVNVINIVVRKAGKTPGYDVFRMAWTVLIQRFENTINHRNFPQPCNPDERGLILCDRTIDREVVKLVRRMRIHNPISHHPIVPASGYRNLPLNYIVEDSNSLDSAHSFFIQAVDLVAFLLYQRHAPNAYIRKKAARRYFDRLGPILCVHASLTDPQGIVYL